MIGGEIKQITPGRGRTLGRFMGYEPGWGSHTVVVQGGRVYDAFTGCKGMSIVEYKALWAYADDLIFGF